LSFNDHVRKPAGSKEGIHRVGDIAGVESLSHFERLDMGEVSGIESMAGDVFDACDRS
jgi:hypothetical protein